MVIASFNGQAQDTKGNAVTDFEVEVRDETDGSLVSLYSDLEGSIPLGNPFTPSSLDNGYFRFYVEQGRYRIRLSNSGGDVADWRDVAIGDDITTIQSELDTVFLNESSNLSDVDTPATAFDNIKQTATSSATGVVEKATAAEVYSSASDKYISADLIESASAAVALTDAATISVDWDSFIFATITLSGNRTLGNATNVQPGTWRVIEVQGNDTTSRTLTFESEYTGDLPTLTDISSNKKYLLMLFGRQSSPSRVMLTAVTSFSN